MIERVARHVKQRNKYVVNLIGYENLLRLLSLADVLHSENPRKVVDDWIEEYQLEKGDFDITDVDKELCTNIPTPLDMGKVYMRLILQTSRRTSSQGAISLEDFFKAHPWGDTFQ